MAQLTVSDWSSSDEINFTNTDLQGADFSNTSSSSSLINEMPIFIFSSGTDLQDSNFKNAEIGSENFSGVNLVGANFTNAFLNSSNFTNAQAELANFTNANLGNTNLTGGNFSDANFKNAGMWNSVVSNANFSNADLNFSTFCDNTGLNTADFYGTKEPDDPMSP